MNIYSVVPLQNLSEENEPTSKADLNYIDAVFIAALTDANLTLLHRELKTPMFKNYKIYFTAQAYDVVIEDLMRSDFYSKITNIFHLNINFNFVNNFTFYFEEAYEFHHCVLSVLLNLGCKKVYLTHPKNRNSDLDTAINKINLSLSTNKLLTFVDNYDTLLVVLNRSDDPYTPLITPWNYESMIYESTFCKDNFLMINGKEYSIQNSDFYYNLKYLDLPTLNDEFEKAKLKLKNSSDQCKFESVKDMNKFIETQISLNKLKNQLNSHLEISSFLGSDIQKRHLFSLSELEQEILESTRSSSIYKTVEQVMTNKYVDENLSKVVRLEMFDKLKILVLFCLKFERESSLVNSLMDLYSTDLKSTGLSEEEQAMLDPHVLVARAQTLYGNTVRKLDSLYQKDFYNRMKVSLTSKQVNTFEQFEPMVYRMAKALGSKLDLMEGWPELEEGKKYKVVMVVKGGISMTESYWINKFNTEQKRFNIHLVGNGLINSKEFISRFQKEE